MGKLDETMGTIAPIVGAGMGMLMGGYNDQRQRNQQEYLQKLQIEGNKEMGKFNQGLALDMWEKTNYNAQKEQMKKAGLNPGLMYGQGGGGGATANAGGGGSVGGATATQGGGGELGMGMQSAMQLALLKAQKENIEADTANKQAEIPVKGATVTNLGATTANTESKTIAQNIENEFQKWRNDDAQGMGQSQAKQQLLLSIQQQHGNITNMEQQFKNMGVDFNNIEASTERIKSETALKEQMLNYLNQANPETLALLRIASQMSEAQLKKFQADPNNTKLGMQVNYGMDKIKDIVDMGTDIYGAKTFRNMINKEPQEQTTTTQETIAHPNGTTTERYQRQHRK